MTVLALAIVALAGSANLGDGDVVDFSRDVLPILSDRCFACHGPDGEGRKAGLRLDRRDDVYSDRGGYSLVVPGDADESELFARVATEFEDERMPPVESNLSLDAREIDVLRRWIEEGGEWSEHWSFVPPVRPSVPEVANSGWVRNPIDAFVASALESFELAPSKAARPHELLRRVTLDLTGLPPTVDELDAFLADSEPGAYERAVDRLMASPRYGERMAWEWLDAARYADTDGFQADPTREMWPWRDWLVDALNDNVPFDRLTLEMLAGDLLPDATPEQVLASAFNRNHMTNGEGGRIFEETRVENIFDRVETTATVWMGLTVGCARCHDHRYDPISQVEYYGLFDFFNQTSDTGRGASGRAPPTLTYWNPAKRARLAEIALEIGRLEAQLVAPNDEWDSQQLEWQSRVRTQLAALPGADEPSTLGAWRVSEVYGPPEGGANALFAHGFAPEAERAAARGWPERVELTDGETHELSPDIGATYLWRELTAPTDRRLSLSFGSDDAIKVWLDGDVILANDTRRGVAPDQERASVDVAAGSHELLVKIVNTGGRSGVYFRVVDESVEGLPVGAVAGFVAAEDADDPGVRAALRTRFRERELPAWRELASRRDALAEKREAIKSGSPRVLVMDQLPEANRRVTRLLHRGGYDDPKDPVEPHVPAFLPPMREDAPRDRRALAEWLTSPTHPLTARVTVNRQWQTFFGRGLVATSEDFGRQGEKPSHPELLDWLAVEFVEGGFDLKALHRLIVTSATYRQSSAASPAAYAEDPYNARLTRGPRHRLPSWMLRDQALFVAGLLDETRGGPPVRPSQPEGVWSEATFGTIRYEPDEGAVAHRRSLYVFWRRIVRPTFFFDTAKRQVCEMRRSITNTPLHALVTMNEPVYVEAARELAARAWRAEGDVESRIARAFRDVTSRAPESAELQLLVERFTRSREYFDEHPGEAADLVGTGATEPPADVPPADLAAGTIVCSILLNLDEVLSKP